MTSRRTWLAILCLLPARLVADTTNGSYVRPSFSLLGVSERGSGAAYAPPADALARDLAVSLGAGLDGRLALEGGRVDWSAFAFVHDPAADDNRGLFAAARVRGANDLGASWRLRFDGAGRVQRRETVTLSDFERSDVSLGLDRKGDVTLGLRVGDRRRWVRPESNLGFDRQSLLASITWGSPGTDRWRLEVGPQRTHARTAAKWRLLGTAEWAGSAGVWTVALRGTWLEPLDASGAGSSAAAFEVALPTAAPIPPVTDPGTRSDAALVPPPSEGLLGPALVVDPLEDDENDWDIGLRKQQLVAVVSRAFAKTTLTAELRADLERGPDLLSAIPLEIERERFAARVHFRRTLGSKWSLLAQGGWQQLRDDRPGLGYSHTLVSIGIELRP